MMKSQRSNTFLYLSIYFIYILFYVHIYNKSIKHSDYTTHYIQIAIQINRYGPKLRQPKIVGKNKPRKNKLKY